MFAKRFFVHAATKLRSKISLVLGFILVVSAMSGIQPGFAVTADFSCGPLTQTYTIIDGVAAGGEDCVGDLIIDPSATSIDTLGFSGAGLTTVHTGVNVLSIGWRAFSDNVSLVSAKLGEMTTIINAGAFLGDISLTQVSPGRSLSTMGGAAFTGAPLNAFTLPPALRGLATAFQPESDPSVLRADSKGYQCRSMFKDGAYSSYLFGLTLVDFCLDSVDPATLVLGITLHGVGFADGDIVDFGSETRTAVVGGDGTTATLDSPYIPTGSANYVRIIHADGGWAETPAPILPCYTVLGTQLVSGANCSGSILIQEGISDIADNAFLDNRSLTGITFPESLRTIGESAFSGTDLSTVVIPDGVTSMGLAAFSDNGAGDSERSRHLTSVRIGNGLIDIPGDAFYKNYALTSVVLGNQVQSIGFKAFSNTAIESITAPSSLSHIYGRAFELSGLSSITFPSDSELVEIGEYAFGSTLLTQISIPDSVTVLGADVFGDTRITSLLNVNYCRSSAAAAYNNESPNTVPGNWLAQRQRLCPDGSRLASLGRSAGAFSEAFIPTNFNYSIPVGFSTLSQEISWEKLEADASVQVMAPSSVIYSDPVSFSTFDMNLLPGENILNLKVTSIDGITVETYTVTINRAPAPFLPRGFSGFGLLFDETSENVLESIAASSDGKKVVAVGSNPVGNAIGRSLNSGSTWTPMVAPDKPWVSVASSASGDRLVAVSTLGEVYHYSEASSGLGWVRSTGPDACTDTWQICSGISSGFSLAMSQDGRHVILGTFTGLSFSDDYGVHFSSSRIETILPNTDLYIVSISADGQTMLASTVGDVYLSKDGGVSWSPVVQAESTSIAPVWIAPNGREMLIAVPDDGGGIIKSIDSGLTWAPLASTSAPLDLQLCSLSATYDVSKIIAGSCEGNFGYSVNSGEDWIYSTEVGDWYGALVSESDGPMYIFRYGRVGSENGKSSSFRATYFRPLDVTSGSAAGGTEVQITGTGFQSGVMVFFGEAVGTVITSTPTSITVKTPAYSSTGLVNVSVTNVDDGSYTLPEAFTYTPAPVVAAAPTTYNYVEYIAVATSKNPKVQKLSIYGGTIEAKISNGPDTTEFKTTIVVPARAIKSDTTFTLSPGTDAGIDGYQILKLTATADDGTLVTSFAKPLSITIPAGANGALAAWSIDGFNWATLPLLQGDLLPAGQADGYFINADGSITLLTRHLTSFGLRKSQAALSIESTSAEIQLTATATVKVAGGSGEGTIALTSDSPATCSVSAAGLVQPLTPGSCLITARKSSTGLYTDKSSMIELTILAPVEVEAPAAVITPVKAIKVSVLSAKATSSTKSVVKVNLSNAYKNRVVAVEIYSKVNGKTKKVIQTKVKLDNNGDAVFTAKNPNLKGLSGKIKAGNKSFTSQVK